MLDFLRASAVADPVVLVVVGLAAVRVVVVAVRAEEVEVLGLVAGLLEETVPARDRVVFFSGAAVPATLDRRSKVDVVGFVGVLLEVLLASDIRFAVPEIPLFSSPELSTDLAFSSAELLTDARDR